MKIQTFSRLIIFTALVAVMSGCAGKWGTPFPNADIVYQTGGYEYPQIGFINSDGSNNTLVPIGKYVAKPMWSETGDALYVLARRISILSGYPSIWREGHRLKSCKEWWEAEDLGGAIETEETPFVLISFYGDILLVDLARCEEVKQLVTSVSSTYLFGLSLSPDKKRFAFGEARNYQMDTGLPEYAVMIGEVSGGKPAQIGTGINPTWSPDGSQIAYLQMDGIYIMNADGSQSHMVYPLDVSSGYDDGQFIIDAPTPRWSPDGEWLLFHRCIGECSTVDENSIVKYELATGNEVVLVHGGGGYPDWRSR